MSQALISRTDEQYVRAPKRIRESTMTCDVPVVRLRPVASADTVRAGERCRPTGRPPRRTGDPASRRGEQPKQWEPRARSAVSAETFEHSARAVAPSRHSNIDPAIRRRRTIGALGVGAVLAGAVWLVAVVGSNVEDAATPSTPGSTQVVHVRTGESLSDVAQRIAPTLPVAGVVEQLRELNHLDTAGLRVSQPLVAPAYR
ncbi:LysM peptidoglycan-binding domain-containing protein [Gordonia humi]